MNDDELARVLRALDPAITPLDAPVPLAAERRLRQIVGRPAAPPARRRRRALLPTAIAASAAIVLAVVAGVIWSPAPSASALTPDPLAFTAVDAASVADVVADAQRALAAHQGNDEPERRSLSLGWYFSGTPDDASATVFRREWVDLNWNADLSGSVVTTAAEATNAAGDTVPADDPTPGTVVGEITFVRTQFAPISRDPVPATPEAMRERFLTSTGAGDAFTAGDAILGIRSLFGEWTASDAQQSALLQVVADLPDARLLGETRDRLGRDVVGIGGVPFADPRYDYTLLVSRDNGRVLGVESTLRDGDESLGLPAGSVTSYTLWDADEWKDRAK